MANDDSVLGSWDWNRINNYDRWRNPSVVVYPLSIRWLKENKMNILDLGCGLGRNSVYLYQQGFKVTAVDASKSAIDRFKVTLQEKGYEIDLRLCDMHSLPFADECFDGVFSFHVIYHTNTAGIRKVISEVYRVLKPDGEVFVTFNSKNNSSYLKNIQYKIDENTIIKQEGIEKGIPHYYCDEKEVKDLMSSFEILRFFYLEDIKPDGNRSCHYFVLAKK